MTSTLKHPLFLLDDKSLPSAISQGSYRVVDLTFGEVKAIMDLHREEDMICCFENTNIENIIYTYLHVEKKQFEYTNAQQMEVGQDGLIFRLYIMPSESQPVINPYFGSEAKKIENVFVYCQLISRTE